MPASATIEEVNTGTDPGEESTSTASAPAPAPTPASGSPAMLDVFNSSGQRGQIPASQMDKAFMQGGYKFAVQKGDAWTPVLPVRMTSPSGDPGWVPAHQAGLALKHGYTVGQPMTAAGDKTVLDSATGQNKFVPGNPQPSGIGERGIDPAVFEGAKKVKEAVSSTGKVLKVGGGTLLKMAVDPTPGGISTALAEEAAQQQRDGGIPNSKEVLLHPLRELAGAPQPGESAMLSAYNNPEGRPSLAMRISNFGSSLTGGDPESARQHYDAAQTALQNNDHATADRELQLAYADKYAVPIATLGLGKLGKLGAESKLKAPVSPEDTAAASAAEAASHEHTFGGPKGNDIIPPVAPLPTPETPGPKTVAAGSGVTQMRPGQEVIEGVPVPRLVGEEAPQSVAGRIQRMAKSQGISPKRFAEFQQQQETAAKQVMQKVFDDLGQQSEGTSTPGESAGRTATVLENVNRSTTPFWRTYDTILHDASPATTDSLRDIVQEGAAQARKFGAENPEPTFPMPQKPQPVEGPVYREATAVKPADTAPQRSMDELARGETFWKITREGKVVYNGGSPRATGLREGDALMAVDSASGEVRVQANRTGISNEQVLQQMGPDVQKTAVPHMGAAENEALWREAVRGQRIGDEAAAQLRRKMGLPDVPADAPVEPNLQDYSRVRTELTTIRDRATDPKVVTRINQTLNRLDGQVAVALKSSGIKGAFENFRAMMDTTHRANAIRMVGSAIDEASSGQSVNASKLTSSLAKMERDGVLYRAFGSQEPIDSLKRVVNILGDAQKTPIGKGRTMAQYAMEVGTAEAAGLISGHPYFGVNYIVARSLEVAGAKGLVRAMTSTKGLQAMNELTTAKTPGVAATAANALLKLAGRPVEDFSPVVSAASGGLRGAPAAGAVSGAERNTRPTASPSSLTPPTGPGASTTAPASLEGLTKQQQVERFMMMVKSGQMDTATADSKIQRLVGSGGRRTIRILLDSRLSSQ